MPKIERHGLLCPQEPAYIMRTQPHAALRARHAGLDEVYSAAMGVPGESREELDGLANLMERLNYNGFFRGGDDDLPAKLRRPPRADSFGFAA